MIIILLAQGHFNKYIVGTGVFSLVSFFHRGISTTILLAKGPFNYFPYCRVAGVPLNYHLRLTTGLVDLSVYFANVSCARQCIVVLIKYCRPDDTSSKGFYPTKTCSQLFRSYCIYPLVSSNFSLSKL